MTGSDSGRSLVWIVDDSALDGERASHVLRGEYEVELFADGSAMLERLSTQQWPVDVLVLDWVMPGVSGIEVCRFLREGEAARPGLAILLLTTQTRTDDIVEGLAAGANDYLVKPYADPELRARVDALVRSSRLLDRAQRAEASLRQLLEQAPDPLISVNHQHCISYVNAEAQRVLGQSARDLAGRSLSEVLPALRPLRLDELGEADQTSLPLDDIQIGLQIFSPTIRSLPTSDEASLTVALRDVTTRRALESRRLDFYSMIAHDLRSPLAAMLMRTELMLRGHRGVLAAAVISDLRKIDGNMRRLVALINDFLDFARMESVTHKLERVRVNMGDLVSEVVDEFRPLMESTRQRVKVEAAEPVVALGDKSRLQQVLANLLTNAIKFTPPDGLITLRVRPAELWCEVVVEDNGPGIPQELLPTLFQRYNRGAAGAGKVPGTGLGLLIVREIVEAHGGTVGVESVLGQGSRFWLRVLAATQELGRSERVGSPVEHTAL